jgi:hypothetical protein
LQIWQQCETLRLGPTDFAQSAHNPYLSDKCFTKVNQSDLYCSSVEPSSSTVNTSLYGTDYRNEDWNGHQRFIVTSKTRRIKLACNVKSGYEVYNYI